MKSKRHIILKQTVEKAFNKTVVAFDDKNQEVISEPRNWGSGFGVTRRRNGETVIGGFRNIVDLGNLKDSQEVTFPDKLTAQFEWTGNEETPVVPVYFGYRTKNGFVPSRPWVDVSVEELDLGAVFAENFNGLLPNN